MAELGEPGEEEAAEAGIDMEQEVVFEGHGSDCLERVDHAMGIGRCGADEHDRPLVDGLRHLVEVEREPRRHPHAYELEVEELGGLGEGGMGTSRGDDLGSGDASLATHVAGHFHGLEQALGAPGCQVPVNRGHAATEEIDGEADEITAQDPDARKGHDVEAVLGREEPKRLCMELMDRIASGVDEAEDLSRAPIAIVGLGGGEVGEHLIGGVPDLWDRRPSCVVGRHVVSL